MSGYFSGLPYDTCAYSQYLQQSTAPLNWELDLNRYVNCNNLAAFHGGQNYPYSAPNQVDLDSSLKGLDTISSSCSADKQPFCASQGCITTYGSEVASLNYSPPDAYLWKHNNETNEPGVIGTNMHLPYSNGIKSTPTVTCRRDRYNAQPNGGDVRDGRYNGNWNGQQQDQSWNGRGQGQNWGQGKQWKDQRQSQGNNWRWNNQRNDWDFAGPTTGPSSSMHPNYHGQKQKEYIKQQAMNAHQMYSNQGPQGSQYPQLTPEQQAILEQEAMNNDQSSIPGLMGDNMIPENDQSLDPGARQLSGGSSGCPSYQGMFPMAQDYRNGGPRASNSYETNEYKVNYPQPRANFAMRH